MIGNSNISLGPAYVISEDYAVKSQQAAAPNRPNAVAALVATNLNVQQQQQQQTNDNAHDRQHQPQDSPQDAEPEPIVDNDLSQVTSFPFCSQSKLHAYHHFCLKSSNLIIQINDRVFQSLGAECFVMTANLIKPVAHRAHTHTSNYHANLFGISSDCSNRFSTQCNHLKISAFLFCSVILRSIYAPVYFTDFAGYCYCFILLFALAIVELFHWNYLRCAQHCVVRLTVQVGRRVRKTGEIFS